MLCIKNKFQQKKIFYKLLLCIFFNIIISFAILIQLRDIGIDLNSKHKLTDIFLEVIRMPYHFFIPLTAMFFCIIIDTIICLKDTYIYRFKSKNNWIENKIITCIYISIFYTLSSYLIILFILNINLDLIFTKDIILNMAFSIILQSLVYIIYSFIGISLSILFLNKKKVAISSVYAFITTGFIIGQNATSTEIINNILLYNYSNISKLIITENNVISALFLLALITFILIEIMYKLSNKTDYLYI